MKIKGENPQLLEELEHLRQRVAELEQVKKERKLAEEVLQESEERYKLLVESSNQAIFTVDKSGLFLFMNTSAARQLGGKPKDFRGKTMWDLFPKEIANRQMADIRKAMETASQLITESASFMQGEKRWFEMNIQPIRNSSGVFDKVLCIAADITERKRAEE
ncbi:PAS domain S-box protein, partial [bacterium]|nr:PAS domain S-box protein [bacterium]